MLYSDATDGSDVPADLLGSFSATTTSGMYAPSSPLTLDANSTYWVVLAPTYGSSDNTNIQYVTPTGASATGGWSTNTEVAISQASGNGFSWSNPGSSEVLPMEVDASAVPEPRDYALMLGIAVLGVVAWRRRTEVVA